jgi:hypothetical protein
MNRSSMTAPMIGGAILILLGLLGFAMPYFTTQHTADVAKIGDLKIEATENRTHTIPPLVSGGAVVLGVVLIGAGLYRKT